MRGTSCDVPLLLSTDNHKSLSGISETCYGAERMLSTISDVHMRHTAKTHGKRTPKSFSCKITMGPAWVCGFAAYPCRCHGKRARKLFGRPFFHGFRLCVAWVRPKSYLTPAPHYTIFDRSFETIKQSRTEGEAQQSPLCRGSVPLLPPS